MSDEVWTGSKRQRDALRNKYDGRCAYCGCVLDRMQADHLIPIMRVTTDPWGRRLPVSEQRQIRPERNVFSNMMPSCGPCNTHKGGHSLEDWREMLGRASEIIGRKQSIFKTAVRLGLIKVNDGPVTFYFEILRAAVERPEPEEPGGHWATRDNEPDSRVDPEGHRDWQRDRDRQIEEGTW